MVIRYCSRCLYPSNHPLLIEFDGQGVCSGCRIHEEKDDIDWAERFQELRRLVEPYRDRTTRRFDCVVPVSGGKDSWFTVHVVKRVLGLNPLLVGFNRHYNTPLGIENLENLRTRLGCDIMTRTLSPTGARTMTRACLELFGSMHWPFLAGSTVFPVQVAVQTQTPLIIWGAHQGLDQVGMYSHHDRVEMTRRYRREHDLMGREAEDLVDLAEGLDETALHPFFYPADRDLIRTGVRGIYLNNYIRWDSKTQHEMMIAAYGYKTAAQARTFDSYNDVHDAHYNGVHDWIKVRRLGFGKATDHACRELRFGRLDRDEALALALAHEAEEPPGMDQLLDWVGLSRDELAACVDQTRDPRLAGADPLRRPPAGTDPSAVRLAPREPCLFTATESGTGDGLQLLARGWAPHLDADRAGRAADVWHPTSYLRTPHGQ